MSLRTFKTFLKRTNQSDKDAIDLVNDAINDEMNFGLEPGTSMLREYADDAVSHSRWCYTRMKRAFKRLRPRQQTRMIYQINASREKRKTLDKVTMKG